MNIQRFILPATIAAAFHAALFWALPREEFIRLIPVVLGPPPPPPEGDIPLPVPVDKNAPVEPLRPVKGGPGRPELPEDSFLRKTNGPTIPLAPRTRGPVDITKVNPPTFGPGETGAPWVGGPPVFRPDDLDRVPHAKVQLPPDYPHALKQAGAEGSVTVEFDVDRTGQVVSARVLHSTHGDFESPTLRAVLKWRFEPGRRNGRAVPFRMQVPVHFRLGETG